MNRTLSKCALLLYATALLVGLMAVPRVQADDCKCTHQGKPVKCPPGLPAGSRSVEFVPGGTQWVTPTGKNVFVAQTTFPACPPTPPTATPPPSPTTPPPATTTPPPGTQPPPPTTRTPPKSPPRGQAPPTVPPGDLGRAEQERARGLLRDPSQPVMPVPPPSPTPPDAPDELIRRLGQSLRQQQTPQGKVPDTPLPRVPGEQPLLAPPSPPPILTWPPKPAPTVQVPPPLGTTPPKTPVPQACCWIDVKTLKPVATAPANGANFGGSQVAVQRSESNPNTAFDPGTGRNFAREPNGCWIDVKTLKPVATAPANGANFGGSQVAVQRSESNPNTAFDPGTGRNFAREPCPPPSQTGGPPPAQPTTPQVGIDCKCTHQGKPVKCPPDLPPGSQSVQFVPGGTQWVTPTGANVFVAQTTFPACPTTPPTATTPPTTQTPPKSPPRGQAPPTVPPGDLGRAEQERARGLLRDPSQPVMPVPPPSPTPPDAPDELIRRLGQSLRQQQTPQGKVPDTPLPRVPGEQPLLAPPSVPPTVTGPPKPPPTVQVPPQQPPMETDTCEELKKALDDAKAELDQLEDAVRRLDAARQKWEQDVKGLSWISSFDIIESRRKWVLGRSKLKQAIWDLKDTIDALQKLIREECSKRAR